VAGVLGVLWPGLGAGCAAVVVCAGAVVCVGVVVCVPAEGAGFAAGVAVGAGSAPAEDAGAWTACVTGSGVATGGFG